MEEQCTQIINLQSLKIVRVCSDIMLSILTRIFICLYWVVLICFNIRNYYNMTEEAKQRNKFIVALIVVNAIVILFTLLQIFIG